MAKVLLMLSAATTRAMPAKTTRKVRSRSRNARWRRCARRPAASPVIASSPSGSTAAMRSRELVASDTPALGGDEDRAHLAGLPEHVAPARLASVNAVQVVWPRPSASPKVAMPTIVTSTGSGVCTTVRVADVRGRPASAAPRLITTSSAASGARPSTSRYGLSSGVVDPAAGLAGRTVAADRRRRRRRAAARSRRPGPSATATPSTRGDGVDQRLGDRRRGRSARATVSSTRWRCARRRRCRPSLGEQTVEVGARACRRARACR